MQKNAETDVVELESLASVDDTGADDESPSSVYEIGYHLLPNLSEEEVSATVAGIMEVLKKNGAAFVGDRFPSKIPLAYSIPKRVTGKVLRFNEAYFGWVAFEISREAVLKIKEALDGNKSVLRFLIVRTDRDAVAAALSGATATAAVRPVGDIGKPKREAEAGGEVSEAALEEALKTIETEDAKTSE